MARLIAQQLTHTSHMGSARWRCRPERPGAKPAGAGSALAHRPPVERADWQLKFINRSQADG